MKKVYEFARLFVVSPTRAAKSCARAGAWRDALKVYILLAVLQFFSSLFDPLAFLDPNAPIAPAHTFGFWISVAFWEPVMMVMSVFFAVLILQWLREGSLPLKTAAATLWSSIPAILAVYYSQPGMTLGKGWFIALLGVWLLPAILFARSIPAQRWREVGVFLLGLSAVQIVCLALEFAIVVPSQSLPAFYAVSILTLLWMLASFGIAMRRLAATSTARAVLSFLFTLLVSSVVPLLAYLLGLMPKEVLKVIIYV